MADENNNTPINHGNITPVVIQDEMKSCYLDYAMSVIVGRALCNGFTKQLSQQTFPEISESCW